MSAVVVGLAGVAVMANAVVYGTDMFAGAVMTSAYGRMDDATMTLAAGWGHHFADRRMPAFGVPGVVVALAATVAAAVWGGATAAIAGGVAVAALLVWLAVYAVVAKPINERQKEAARTGVIPADARDLQRRWDSVAPLRIALQAVALVALLVMVAI
ncbi:DUF1772 domain-containing protein [uncultured Williamsia sp.]|uniref:DUF1772 domain-containing protein n=1 Tax=uncultured Williamsia sp. TaxID=259311 RepID=UPI00261E7634|nr:DUF1772 domain-containing protein [uncultured Williamsia sp.]